MKSNWQQGAWIVARSLFLLSLARLAPAGAETLRDGRLKMGDHFEITVVATDHAQGQAAIDAAYAEIDRLEAMISEWQPTSETSAINRKAGIAPVHVSPELFNLIRRCLKVSEATDGAFDITFASFGKLWDFKAQPPKLPDAAAIREGLRGVGWRKVILDEAKQTVFLSDSRTRLGFGGIGQGFAVNRAAFILKEHGIQNGVIDGSGDLLLLGHKEDGTAWDVGIGDPRQPDRSIARLSVTDTAVTTCGDYEKFFVLDGKRYGHILDPRTGYPVDSVQSVTVICPDAELADALDTGLFVLGPEKGLELCNELHGVKCVIVDREGRIHASKDLKIEPIQEKHQR